MSDFLVVNRGSAVTWGFAIPVDTRAVVSTSTRARWHLPRMGKCVDQCQGTMTSMSLIATDSLPVEPLDVLREVSRAEAQLDEFRWKQIAAARDAGASWAAIGEALGVSRQSAWEYFTRRVSTELAANVENSDLSEDEAMDIAVEEVRTVRRSLRAR